jgi:hypothetical protein
MKLFSTLLLVGTLTLGATSASAQWRGGHSDHRGNGNNGSALAGLVVGGLIGYVVGSSNREPRYEGPPPGYGYNYPTPAQSRVVCNEWVDSWGHWHRGDCRTVYGNSGQSSYGEQSPGSVDANGCGTKPTPTGWRYTCEHFPQNLAEAAGVNH